MRKVLVAGKIHDDGLQVLRGAPDITLTQLGGTAPLAALPRHIDADAVLLRTQPLDGEQIAAATNLKIVSRHGVGYDLVDVAALNRRRIPLAIVGNVNAITVAEHAMALVLACAKQVTLHDSAVRSGGWQVRDELRAGELHGKSLLVIGFGRIGRQFAAMASGFGMRLSAYDPYLDAAVMEEAGVRQVTNLDDGLADADYVSIHIPKAGTEPIIGADQLARMKPTAIIVNTSRGGLIDEEALAAALVAGRLGAAGIDVLSNEPPRPEHPLLAAPRVILSPHVAGLSLECARRMAVIAARNILDCFAGQLDPTLVVNAGEIGLSKAS
ncbi:MAG: hydroxyacid dehydrogenase [Alphaproteobacteria bacterium]